MQDKQEPSIRILGLAGTIEFIPSLLCALQLYTCMETLLGSAKEQTQLAAICILK